MMENIFSEDVHRPLREAMEPGDQCLVDCGGSRRYQWRAGLVERVTAKQVIVRVNGNGFKFWKESGWEVGNQYGRKMIAYTSDVVFWQQEQDRAVAEEREARRLAHIIKGASMRFIPSAKLRMIAYDLAHFNLFQRAEDVVLNKAQWSPGQVVTIWRAERPGIARVYVQETGPNGEGGYLRMEFELGPLVAPVTVAQLDPRNGWVFNLTAHAYDRWRQDIKKVSGVIIKEDE
jgi:hypothetical protein